MKLNFKYEEEKDIWCLVNYGAGSKNSSMPTEVYVKLLDSYGNIPSNLEISKFIKSYLKDKNIEIGHYISKYQNEWQDISLSFQERTEQIFKISIPEEIKAFLSVNNRCPYNIAENYFFVTIPSISTNKTVMHELWHFYTWYKFGVTEEVKLGKQRYNDIKEALTVLLNVECKDLMPDGVVDNGYPQHAGLREKILEYWKIDRNINNLWDYISQE